VRAGVISGVDETETLFDVLKTLFNPVKPGIMMNESLLNLADAELQILNVVFHALDAAADDAQMFQDQTVRVASHGITLAEKG
jgi:hypothetical protein